MIQFIDKSRRKISIEINEDTGDIIAYHDDDEIAFFDYHRSEGVEPYDDTIYELWGMNVKEEYQKSGIGTEIIKLGKEHFINVVYPRDTGSHEGNHLSSEGKALLDSCIDKGILEEYECYDIDDDTDDK